MGWRLCVDRGGTFTDVVLVAPDGRLAVHKLGSRDAEGREGLARAVELALREGGALEELRLGTTVATNALLERAGVPVRLLLTRGFGDLLVLDDQRRPELFELAIRRPPPLAHEVVEIDERVDADGRVLRALDERAVRAALAGAEHVAVCLAHADRHPAHERRIGELARELGVRAVTLSHAVSPSEGYLARASTTLLDAALTPVLQASLDALPAPARTRRLAMQSSGGLVDVARFRGKDAVLSGPAGGVVAVRHVAARAGFAKVLGVDMGGTSTDVCRWDAEGAPLVHGGRLDGLRLRAPRLDLVTVAAGGGSILARVDGRFRVGPASAGAHPGPACYGHGGPPTLTDAALVLGLLRPAFFASLALDVGAARAALSRFGDPVQAARGFLEVAHERTAAAVRQLSVARGKDPREHALVAFGGAGGQHACALARRLGVRTVLVPAHAGVLSAWGLARADLVAHAERPVLPGAAPDFPDAEARDALAAQGAAEIELIRRVDARYAGAEAALTLPWSERWRDDFAARHREAHGFARPGHPVELTVARVEARAAAALPDEPAAPVRSHRAEPVPDPAPDDGTAHDGRPLFERARLAPGAWLAGPALVVEPHATTVVDAGWRAEVDGHGVLRLADTAPGEGALALGERADPVGLELFGHRLMALATEMGEHLRRVAHSTNIKERRDFSCAVFDAQGQLLANAPHIPVHLGAMGESVRDVLAHENLRPGDAWVGNDPAAGGSHLPDLTLVTPVFDAGARLLGFVANRGHHADVGGSQPGSMPPHSTRLDEEGAVLRRVLLARDGALREDEARERLAAAGTRGLDERLADLRAQTACNALGARRLQQLADELGAARLGTWMGHLLDHGEQVMADVVAGLRPGAARDALDDGTPLAVSVRADGGRAVIDFAGTGPRGAHNRHAPRAVVRACVLYVFRCLAARAIPLNAGCFRRLEVRIPEGCLLDPQPGDAVVGGNVETSQRLVDLLLRALGLAAASQGTMNNLTFGDGGFGCYETVGGGAGAGFGHDGASGVHTHMTNTAITDPEVLERRHPVRVERFALRRGSGGLGVWRGGDGVLRELAFTRPLQCALLAESRRRRPRGLHAGSGLPGREELGPHGVRLWTPGGGGCSPSPEQWAAMTAADARALFVEDRWRGPTAGIARDARRGQVLAVRVEQVDELLATLGARVLHRGAPGARTWAAGDVELDLTRCLPLYERRGPSRDGVRPGPVLASAPELHLARDELLLVLALPGAPTPVLPLPVAGGAPGRELLLDG